MLPRQGNRALRRAISSERVKLAQPTVSHHMRILEKADVVEAKREGHWRWYRRNEKLIAEMMRDLKGQL